MTQWRWVKHGWSNLMKFQKLDSATDYGLTLLWLVEQVEVVV